MRLRRFLIRFEIALREVVDLTWTGDRLADRSLVALRHMPDLSRDELAYLLAARTDTIDAALAILQQRRLAIPREVWRITE